MGYGIQGQGHSSTSGIWSMIRRRQYFETVSAGLKFNLEPPTSEDTESVTLLRKLPTFEP